MILTARSRVFGPSPLFALMQSTLVREYPVWWQLGLILFGMPARGPSRPHLVGFRGRRPCARSTIVRWQEATDPQSPEGGSQRACHTEGAHPTASGRGEGVALMKQSALLGSQNAVSLGCQPGRIESTPCL